MPLGCHDCFKGALLITGNGFTTPGLKDRLKDLKSRLRRINTVVIAINQAGR